MKQKRTKADHGPITGEWMLLSIRGAGLPSPFFMFEA
jgi:hypothetical protein